MEWNGQEEGIDKLKRKVSLGLERWYQNAGQVGYSEGKGLKSKLEKGEFEGLLSRETGS